LQSFELTGFGGYKVGIAVKIVEATCFKSVSEPRLDHGGLFSKKLQPAFPVGKVSDCGETFGGQAITIHKVVHHAAVD
jgi:hypothetical protein